MSDTTSHRPNPRAPGAVPGGAPGAPRSAPGEDMPLHDGPPIGDLTIVYLGPLAPHWEIHTGFGDPQALGDFKARAEARLMLLPPHDPQFKRNQERINRDALRTNVVVKWDLGYEEEPEPELPERPRNF